MPQACPVQTPLERERGMIVSGAEAALPEKVLAALREAEDEATAGLRASGLAEVPSLREVFATSIHQTLYCLLRGADLRTFAGGDAKAAVAIIRNSQQIAKHRWDADIEPYPRP